MTFTRPAPPTPITGSSVSDLAMQRPCFEQMSRSTSVNAWITPFVNFCKDNDVPVDFVSTHHYPSDDPLGSFGMNGPGFKAPSMSPDGMKDLSPEEIQKIVKRFTKPRENKNPREILSLIAQTLAYNHDLVEGYS